MKKVTRLLAFSFALLILTTCLTGCGSQSDVEVKWDLSMAVNGTDTQIDSLVANHFAELVAERSGGTIVINVFPNDTLAGGNATKGIEYVAVGSSDLGAYATSVLAGLEPKISVATIPWAFTSYEQARNVIDTSGGEYYAEMLAPKGINGLGSAVCEVVAEMGKGIVKRVGVQDQFGQSAPYERLLAINGITAENIVSIAEKLH